MVVKNVWSVLFFLQVASIGIVQGAEFCSDEEITYFRNYKISKEVTSVHIIKKSSQKIVAQVCPNRFGCCALVTVDRPIVDATVSRKEHDLIVNLCASLEEVIGIELPEGITVISSGEPIAECLVNSNYLLNGFSSVTIDKKVGALTAAIVSLQV